MVEDNYCFHFSAVSKELISLFFSFACNSTMVLVWGGHLCLELCQEMTPMIEKHSC